jgi:hypothetical protein
LLHISATIKTANLKRLTAAGGIWDGTLPQKIHRPKAVDFLYIRFFNRKILNLHYQIASADNACYTYRQQSERQNYSGFQPHSEISFIPDRFTNLSRSPTFKKVGI